MENLRNLDQFPFEFYGEYFAATLASDRWLYLPVRDMRQSLGVQTNGQLERIRSHEAIADALRELGITRSYGDSGAQIRSMFCQRLDRLPF